MKILFHEDMVRMLTLGQVIKKGFIRTEYKDQVGVPIFYTREFVEKNDVEKIFNFLFPSVKDFDFENVKCIVEITENLDEAQYLFTEQKFDTGYFEHDQLSVRKFKQLLEII